MNSGGNAGNAESRIHQKESGVYHAGVGGSSAVSVKMAMTMIKIIANRKF